jgi:outer membrane autotransporter protein
MDLARADYRFNPYALFHVLRTKVDGYVEKGGDGTMSLTIDDQEVTSVTGTLGLSVSRNFSVKTGVLSPYIRGEYVHEFNDQADSVRGYLTIIPQANFTLRPNDVDRHYSKVGAGLVSTFRDGLSGFVDANLLVGFRDLDAWGITAGLRKEF